MLELVGLTAIGLILLIIGAEFFVDSAAKIAAKLGASPFFIGAVIIGFGTSLPELLVSASAALNQQTPLAIGNVIGSNIANIALILAIGALLTRIEIDRLTRRRYLPLLIITGFLALALTQDGELSRMDSGILLATFVLALWILNGGGSDDTGPTDAENTSTFKLLAVLLAGGIALLAGANWLVDGAVGIARIIGVSEFLIGITIVAVGSSLPELAATVSSARRGHGEMILGNIAGSNVFNILLVMPIAGLIHPSSVPAEAISRDLPIMLAFTIALFLMCLSRSGGLKSRSGGILLTGYLAYIFAVTVLL
ncbi:MAG: calcium/sodium antiporter [Gammaproteobacteria bacterium]|nr:calcium/sodium antiporter [Gammaproteobacteria bacterium]